MRVEGCQEEEEEFAPNKKRQCLNPKVAAKERMAIYRTDAMIDFVLEHGDSDGWIVDHVLLHNRYYYSLRVGNNNTLIVIDRQKRQVVYRIERGRGPYLLTTKDGTEHERLKLVTRYPWMRTDDDSFLRLLTVNVLTKIVSFLKTPQDVFNASRTCKILHKACSAPLLYDTWIPKLLDRCQITELPFYDPTFKPHQYFFAMCFFTCKTDRELELKIMEHISKGNIVLARFCVNAYLDKNVHMPKISRDAKFIYEPGTQHIKWEDGGWTYLYHHKIALFYGAHVEDVALSWDRSQFGPRPGQTFNAFKEARILLG